MNVKFCRLYEGEEMDVEAIFGTFECEVGPDCFKDILPTFEQRIKLYRSIKAAVAVVY